MRVGFFTFRIDQAPTGLANYTVALSRALRDLDAGMEIVLLNPHPESGFDWYGEFETVPLRLGRWERSYPWADAIAAPITLARAVRKHKLDIVHAPANVAPFVGPRLGCKRVATIHDVAPLVLPHEHRFVARAATRTMIPPLRWTADAIVTVSDSAADDIARFGRIPRSKITVTPNGVDRPADAELEAWSRLPSPIEGLAEDTNFLLAVGDIRPRKNLGRVIEAFERLDPEHGDLKLVVVGQMMHRPPEGLSGGGSTGNRIVCTGYVGPDALHWLYVRARALVMPSLYEGFGLPALEAMAYGLPVIASDSGALRELVGEAGVLVDPFDVGAISKAMEEIVRDPVAAREVSKRGRRRSAEFTWRRTAELTAQVYRRLVPA